MPIVYDDDTLPIYSGQAIQGSTYMRVAWGPGRNWDLPPVIDLHGWPLTFPFVAALGTYTRRALIAAGYTVLLPWCGANWGHPTAAAAAASGPAGTGLAAITDARTFAGSTLGLPTTKVHLYGDSMGGQNALAWALANPTLVGGIWCDQPVTSLGFLWDLGGLYRGSIESAWGTTGRANVLAAASAADPVQNYAGLQAFADRIAIFASREDTVVGWTTTVEMLSTAVPLTLIPTTPEGEAGGDHGDHTDETNWDEFAVLRHFEANAS